MPGAWAMAAIAPQARIAVVAVSASTCFRISISLMRTTLKIRNALGNPEFSSSSGNLVVSRRLGRLKKLDPIRPMTAEQVATLKRLAEAAYELDAFKPNLTRAEADLRIAMLTAKLKLLDEPPHTL